MIDTIIDTKEKLTTEAEEVLNYAMWSSEPIPFDAMEIAIHEAYSNFESEDERPLFKMVHEYPLSGKPPMMTHVFENESGNKIIAAKGAPEALIEVSYLNETEKNQILTAMKAMTQKGFRVLGGSHPI